MEQTIPEKALCAVCLEYVGLRVDYRNGVIKVHVNKPVIGIEKEVLISKGRHKFHKKCWESIRGG